MSAVPTDYQILLNQQGKEKAEVPYITQTDKDGFKTPLVQLRNVVKSRGLSNGELNWLMTKLALLYIEQHGESYNTLSDVIKAFECAKLEFYRRMVVPYEDKKRKQNGDCY